VQEAESQAGATSEREADDADRERVVRRQILRGARECFVRVGINGTSMRDVAHAAGVSRGTVYRYFADRAALVREFADWQNQRFRREAKIHLARFDPIEEKLAQFAVFMIDYMQRGGATTAHAVRVNTEIHALYMNDPTWSVFGGLIEWTEGLLASARARGQVRADLDLRFAAEWISRVYVSLASVPGVSFDTSRPDELYTFVRSFIVRGLR
jgi:AcrR family transcriptional regulator